MRLSPVMTAAIFEEAYRTDEAERLAAHCQRLGRRFVAVEGFSGSGKTALAKDLSARMDAPLISIDEYLSADPDSIVIPSYVDRLEQGKLRHAASLASIAVIEGILLRDVLVEIAVRSDLVVVYLARCSQLGTSLIWHDGVRIEDGDGDVGDVGWLAQSELEYHRRIRPHEDADAVVLRVECTFPKGDY
jgi:hypothetical protein